MHSGKQCHPLGQSDSAAASGRVARSPVSSLRPEPTLSARHRQEDSSLVLAAICATRHHVRPTPALQVPARVSTSARHRHWRRTRGVSRRPRWGVSIAPQGSRIGGDKARGRPQIRKLGTLNYHGVKSPSHLQTLDEIVLCSWLPRPSESLAHRQWPRCRHQPRATALDGCWLQGGLPCSGILLA